MSVTLNINGKTVQAEEGMTILEAARLARIDIPTLCHLEKINTVSACRVCVVEAEGEKKLLPACSTAVREGMHVLTETPRVREARRRNLELLCWDHSMSCTECPRGADCRLRELCQRCEVDDEAFGKGERKRLLDESMPHLLRDNSKCILCRRCEATCRVGQTVEAIFVSHRGAETTVGFGLPLRETDCVSCGQCVAACPTGALSVHDDTKRVWKAIYDKSKLVIAAVSAGSAQRLAELFGQESGTDDLGKIAALLRGMGVDLIIDASAFAGEYDVELRAAVTEALERGKTPVLQCSCFAARQFVERFFPAYRENILPLPNRRNLLARRCKAALADRDVFFVSIENCLSAKTERLTEADSPVDAALSTQELFAMIRRACVSSFTAGQIWQSIAAEKADTLPFLGEHHPAAEREAVSEKTLELAKGRRLRLLEVTGLGNVRRVLTAPDGWDLIKLDACPGGCWNGGGAPALKR